MSREQPGEEDGAMGTEVGPVGDENVETEVEFRPPRGTNQMSEEMPIITGVVRTETDERDPGQTNRNGPSLSCRNREFRDHVGRHREAENSRKSWEPTGSCLECRPQRIWGPIGSHRVPGQGR